MKIDYVIKLLDAGYTREEIKAMEDPTPAAIPADPVPDPEPEPAAAAEAAPAGSDAYGGADLAKAFDDAINRLNSIVDEKVKQIQTANVQAARLPDDSKPQTAEDIIGKIIKPDATMGRRKREE